jgi:rare lipoprotein A (peptidoglycan hydrolase)
MKRQWMAGFAGFLAGVIVLAEPASAHPQQQAHSQHRTAGAQQDEAEFVNASGWIRKGEVIQKGTASYYGNGRLSRYTANGDVFDKSAMTAAHPWLPFGTRVLVRDESSGREVTVTVNDRLPTRARVIDLSIGAARVLGILHRGVTTVSLEHTT